MTSNSTKLREALNSDNDKLFSHSSQSKVVKTNASLATRKISLRNEKNTNRVSADTFKSPRLKSKLASSMPSTQRNTFRNKSTLASSASAKVPVTPGWKRKPKHAHSGVPVPEKMRDMLDKIKENATDVILKSPRLRSMSASTTQTIQTIIGHTPHKCASSAPASTKAAVTPGWKRKPKHAHSGVPVPEKMRKVLEKLRDNHNLGIQSN